MASIPMLKAFGIAIIPPSGVDSLTTGTATTVIGRGGYYAFSGFGKGTGVCTVPDTAYLFTFWKQNIFVVSGVAFISGIFFMIRENLI